MKTDENKYGVYVLLDQTKKKEWSFAGHLFYYEPFYVGEGLELREYQHFVEAFQRNLQTKKCQRIRHVKSVSGKDPIVKRFIDNISKKTAQLYEIAIISELGRNDLGTGPLLNETSGGPGINGLTPDKLLKVVKDNKISSAQRLLYSQYAKCQPRNKGKFGIKSGNYIGSISNKKTPGKISPLIISNGPTDFFFTNIDSCKVSRCNKHKFPLWCKLHDVSYPDMRKVLDPAYEHRLSADRWRISTPEEILKYQKKNSLECYR